jgi:GMP synthase-like glutamine amidotransferase
MHVLMLTHGPSVGPGVFAEAVEDAGGRLTEWSVPAGAAAPSDADAIIVLGGGMHPDQEERHPWLAGELRFLADALERDTPVLGVCLGAQLLARAAGAPVRPAREPEVGWHEVELTGAGVADSVLSALPSRFDAFQWHHYTYGIPDGAAELARSAVCTQAFRLGSAVGIQFHAEVTSGMIESWLAEAADEVAEPERLRIETAARIDAWNELGRRLCRAFLAGL